ncbi:hypothetical protein CEXT_637961 [Caerostris extrusa]|uniref:Uncharacterized protein n=1 Tax=Caerostris extrusa TaxID=172846 RepID=A0AAV4TLK3_CAEEX|nr:hypothetical protein CEXT_637961 [Caerostris extrusa]
MLKETSKLLRCPNTFGRINSSGKMFAFTSISSLFTSLEEVSFVNGFVKSRLATLAPNHPCCQPTAAMSVVINVTWRMTLNTLGSKSGISNKSSEDGVVF